MWSWFVVLKVDEHRFTGCVWEDPAGSRDENFDGATSRRWNVTRERAESYSLYLDFLRLLVCTVDRFMKLLSFVFSQMETCKNCTCCELHPTRGQKNKLWTILWLKPTKRRPNSKPKTKYVQPRRVKVEVWTHLVFVFGFNCAAINGVWNKRPQKQIRNKATSQLDKAVSTWVTTSSFTVWKTSLKLNRFGHWHAGGPLDAHRTHTRLMS